MSQTTSSTTPVNETRTVVPTNAAPPMIGNCPIVTPANRELVELGYIFAVSRFFKDSSDAAKAIVKIKAGRELGLGDIAAMTGIFVVKEKITLSATLMGSLVQRSGRYDYRLRTLTSEMCEIEFFAIEKNTRSGDTTRESLGVSSFSLTDAKTAGLVGNDTYRKFTRNMLYARAMSNGVKWYCPAVLGGVPAYLPEEIDERLQPDEQGSYPQLNSPTAQQDVIDVEPEQPSAAKVPDNRAGLLAVLKGLMTDTATPDARLTKHYKVAQIDDLSQEQLENAIANLNAKKAMKKPTTAATPST